MMTKAEMKAFGGVGFRNNAVTKKSDMKYFSGIPTWPFYERYLSLATTIPSSWSSRPSGVIMKLSRDTLVASSGR